MLHHTSFQESTVPLVALSSDEAKKLVGGQGGGDICFVQHIVTAQGSQQQYMCTHTVLVEVSQ